MNESLNKSMIDHNWLHRQFETFNRDYFDNKLPCPRLSLSKARTKMGSMSYKKKTTLGRTTYYNYTIHISTYYQLTERQYQNVLLHEMIHYYIAYHQIKDTAPHGEVFQQMMCHLNTKYGWEMTVSTKTNGIETNHHAAKQITRLVLALEIEGQGCYLSVVNPHYALHIDSQLKNLNHLKRSAWYISDDPFFERMPAVRSLRGRKVSPKQFDEITATMETFTLPKHD